MSTDPEVSTQSPADARSADAVVSEPPAVDQVQPVSLPHDGAKTGVKKALLSSAVWTMIGFAATQIIRILSLYILSWLLKRDVFGLMGVIEVFILGLHMFSDVGIGTSVIRHERGDEENFLNTAWTLQCLRGLALWLCSCLIAWPVASFFDEPGLPSLLWLVPVAGLTALINGFNSTSLFTLERRLAQQRLMLLQLANQIMGVSVTIAWVIWIEPTVWALVIGRLTASTVEMVGSHFLVPGFRNRFHWDRTAIHELLHFGKWIFLSTICTFTADRSDVLVIAKLQDFGMAGVYNFAVRLASLPRELLYAIIFKLVFPLYSRMNAAGRNMREVFCRVHPVAAGAAAFLLAGLIATAPPAVRCLLQSEFWDAGWMAQTLAIGVWFTILEAAEDAILFTLGLPRVSAMSNFAKLVSLPIVVTLGVYLGDLRDWMIGGLIVGFVSADLVRYALTAWFTHRQGMPVFRYDLLLSLLLAGSSVLGYFAGSVLWPYPIDPKGPRDWFNPLIQSLVNGGVVVLMWAALALIGWRNGMFRRSWDDGTAKIATPQAN